MPAVRRWRWGQVDVKSVLTTIVATAIISAFGYIWKRLEAVTVVEMRLARIEDRLEQVLDPKAGQPAKKR